MSERDAERRERLGLFGGSFDPIHRGHIEPVALAVEKLELDRVLYLPTAKPPHKARRDFAPALRRYTMVELALLDHAKLQVDDFEMVHRQSYTVDTVRAFAPGRDLYLFLGADSLLALDQWREWRELVATCRIVVLERPGYTVEIEALVPEIRGLHEDSRLHFLDHPPWPVSSTEIRRRLSARDNQHGVEDLRVRELVPEPVLEYIEKYGLYGVAGVSRQRSG